VRIVRLEKIARTPDMLAEAWNVNPDRPGESASHDDVVRVVQVLAGAGSDQTIGKVLAVHDSREHARVNHVALATVDVVEAIVNVQLAPTALVTQVGMPLLDRPLMRQTNDKPSGFRSIQE